jgi:hypothetical protein
LWQGSQKQPLKPPVPQATLAVTPIAVRVATSVATETAPPFRAPASRAPDRSAGAPGVASCCSRARSRTTFGSTGFASAAALPRPDTRSAPRSEPRSGVVRVPARPASITHGRASDGRCPARSDRERRESARHRWRTSPCVPCSSASRGGSARGSRTAGSRRGGSARGSRRHAPDRWSSGTGDRRPSRLAPVREIGIGPARGRAHRRLDVPVVGRLLRVVPDARARSALAPRLGRRGGPPDRSVRRVRRSPTCGRARPQNRGRGLRRAPRGAAGSIGRRSCPKSAAADGGALRTPPLEPKPPPEEREGADTRLERRRNSHRRRRQSFRHRRRRSSTARAASTTAAATTTALSAGARESLLWIGGREEQSDAQGDPGRRRAGAVEFHVEVLFAVPSGRNEKVAEQIGCPLDPTSECPRHPDLPRSDVPDGGLGE